MGVPWHTSGHLTVDRDGILWSAYRRGRLCHGPIETAEVGRHQADDYHRLLALWLDRFDAPTEARHAYLAAVGAR